MKNLIKEEIKNQILEKIKKRFIGKIVHVGTCVYDYNLCKIVDMAYVGETLFIITKNASSSDLLLVPPKRRLYFKNVEQYLIDYFNIKRFRWR